MTTTETLLSDVADNVEVPSTPPEPHQKATPENSDRMVYRGLTATYSPDDNKLRLYSLQRLDAETYKRARALGFIFAPKQDLFVAPAWTPNREDFLIELCGEVGDEDTSLVERAAERAERFDEYSDKRAKDATAAYNAVQAVGQRFEFGQPILVGHHSERKARKDAQRMENNMRRAVSMWETSGYWESRAAGALAHAKHKERPDVRARRIKTIEADKRKQEKIVAEASAMLKCWQIEGLTQAQALDLANRCHSYRCYPLADFPRDPPASQYEGQMHLASALDGGVITVEQARSQRLTVLPVYIARAQRWIDHFDNRLLYERAMLQEQGGLITDRFNIEIGGQVLVGREWLTVMRVNKSGARINSVSTNRRFVRIVSIEKVADYKPPEADVAQTIKAVTKVAPMANYPGENFVHVTQAEWEAVGKDYRGTDTKAATETVGRHRVRHALGVFLPRLPIPEAADKVQRMNYRHDYYPVYITDAKRVDPPRALPDSVPVRVPAIKPAEPAHSQVVAPVSVPAAPRVEREDIEQIRARLRAGLAVQVVNAPQLFPTPPELAKRMVSALGDAMDLGARLLEPSAGTGRLLQALPGVVPFPSDQRQTVLKVVAVEINHELASQLDRSGLAHTVVQGDFLTFDEAQLGGPFDLVLMNPPYAKGQDIQHIKHAASLLRPGGRLVALCGDGPRQNEQLRPWVEECGGDWEQLPPDSFKSEGTGVRVVMLTVTV
jgi:hypothetical protein